MVSYATPPHRLEHCTRGPPRLHDRPGQPGEWPPARLDHLHAAWHSRSLVAAASVGQAAPRLAPADPSPALGSPYRLRAAGAAAGHGDARSRHLVGRRWRCVLCRVQSVELAYCPGPRDHSGHRVAYVRTRQTAAQTRYCRKTTGSVFQCLAPGRCGALARTAAHPTYFESAWRQAALHRLARDGQLRWECLSHHKLGR